MAEETETKKESEEKPQWAMTHEDYIALADRLEKTDQKLAQLESQLSQPEPESEPEPEPEAEPETKSAGELVIEKPPEPPPSKSKRERRKKSLRLNRRK